MNESFLYCIEINFCYCYWIALPCFITSIFTQVLVMGNRLSKMLILSVYNEVKTKHIYNQVYSYEKNKKKKKNTQHFQHLRLVILIVVWGVATISINPNTRSTGAARISTNPARHTLKANASWRGWYNKYLIKKYNSDNSSQGQKDTWGSLI